MNSISPRGQQPSTPAGGECDGHAVTWVSLMQGTLCAVGGQTRRLQRLGTSMTLFRSAHRPLALVALSVAAGCVGPSAPAPSPLAVSLTFSRTALRASETLVATVVGTNASSEAIQVPNSPCVANLDVRNERDEAVSLGDPRICILPLYPPKTLAPGESRTETFVIVHAMPGQYRVRGAHPAPVGTDGYVFSAFTTVSIAP